MSKFIVTCALTLSLFSSLAFAEGGGDRVFERNQARAQEALAAQQKDHSDIEDTVKSDTPADSEGSS